MSSMPAVRGLNAVLPAISVEAISRPARTFTGDFYVTHRSGNRLWIALGDVAGKGLPAAIVMAMIQEELEQRIASCASAECDPARTAQRLHEFLLPLLPPNRFATATIAWLDDDGTLTIVNAGHPPPLIVRRNGTIDEVGSTGPLLGILKQPKWSSRKLRLEEGDSLVLYSDGVTESELDGAEIGVDGLRTLLARSISPGAIIESLKTSDDLTIVVASRG
jgi:phosphoserine phosphatase RsbU/P